MNSIAYFVDVSSFNIKNNSQNIFKTGGNGLKMSTLTMVFEAISCLLINIQCLFTEGLIVNKFDIPEIRETYEKENTKIRYCNIHYYHSRTVEIVTEIYSTLNNIDKTYFSSTKFDAFH